MPSKIRVLDEQTINKIAAGEVIENPSSVVKELVENSMDAGATEICVEIKGGGRQLIRISDNGCGMNSDDALLCLERHATSKIREIDDIHSIYTMGFRGEAIPSIASISKFTLMTCPQPDNAGDKSKDTSGTMVVVDGGKVVQCSSIARSPGTTIEVKSLFFNVPVRKKFQRSPAYDVNEILKMISSIALGNPKIKFELISDQKTLLAARSTQEKSLLEALKQRIDEVLGEEFATGTCPIEITKGENKLQGFIGTPGNTRHNRTGQYLFINKRPVISPLVSFAVRDGYGSSLPPNRHPIFVLYLTVPGMLVDVNVHPQKREVRLRQEQALKELIMQAVRDGLQASGPAVLESHNLPAMDFSFAPPSPIKEPSAPFTFSRKPDSFNLPIKDVEFQLPKPLQAEKSTPLASQTPPQLFSSPTPIAPKVLATMRQYILVDASTFQKGEGICVIDQRLAHARIIFERLSEQAQKRSLQLPVQTLLIPHTFTTSPVESALLLEHLEALNNLGLSIRQSGPNAFLVDAIPQVFGNTDMRALITEFVQTMAEFDGGNAVLNKIESQIALAASRSAVSQQRRLTIDEAQGLVNQLVQCKTPFQCPKGRPVVICLSHEELAKRFQK